SFGYWSGACSGGSPSCSVTMSSDQSVIATFLIDYYSISISTFGTGVGSVGTNPSGPTFANGTSVDLIAAPAGGSQFAGWTGDCASFGMQSTCTLLVKG